MAIFTQNHRLDQGADFDIEFQLFSDEAQTIPFDLTGWSAEMMVRRDFDRPAINSLTASTSNGKITFDIPQGIIHVHYEPEDSRATNVRFVGEELECVYDLELTGPLPDEQVIRLVDGTITIDKEVTR